MSEADFTIAVEVPDRSDVAALLAEARAYSLARYPEESNHRLPIEQLMAPSVTFLVVRHNGVQHCDLHCGNVLSDNGGRPMVIVYPDTGGAFASLDPIALKLRTIFHKDGPDRAGWPTEAHAGHWTDVGAYSRGAAYEPFIRSRRAWAGSVAGSPQEVLAVAYSYTLRQLKYEDTSKALVRAIVNTCIADLVGGAD